MLKRLRRFGRRLRWFFSLVGGEYTDWEPGMRFGDNRVWPGTAWDVACEFVKDEKQQAAADAQVARAMGRVTP
jgi:hypothetical protein